MAVTATKAKKIKTNTRITPGGSISDRLFRGVERKRKEKRGEKCRRPRESRVFIAADCDIFFSPWIYSEVIFVHCFFPGLPIRVGEPDSAAETTKTGLPGISLCRPRGVSRGR